MRSVAVGSFARLSDVAALWKAWRRCRRGKRRQPRVAAFDLDVDRHIFSLHRQLRRGGWWPRPFRLQVVQDPKTRLVAAPALQDRIVQDSLLAEIGPTYERSFVDQSFACRTGRGPQRAALAYLKAMRTHRFRMILDVRRYFASIDHAILLRLLARRLRDADTVELLRRMLEAGGRVYHTALAKRVLGLEGEPLPLGCGLPLGSHLSHWSGGLYLDGLDHHVLRQLRPGAYLRYMDDMALFANSRGELEDLRVAISDWLWQQRGLRLKRSGDSVRPTSEAATYLGWRLSRAGVLPGPKAKRRLRERLRTAQDPRRLARQLRSYRGLLLTI